MTKKKKKKKAEKLKFVLGRLENIVGKEENAGYQHFLLFPKCFQKTSILGSLKVGIGGTELCQDRVLKGEG